MQSSTPPSTANIAVASAIVAGVTGYMLGQAKSLGLFGGSPISQPSQGSMEKASDSEEDESSNEDDDNAPAAFPGHGEECKMVLVVRTDLGMTKGRSHILCCRVPSLTRPREDWCSMWTRSPGLLQALSTARAQLDDTRTVGTDGPGQGGTAGQERGGARDAAGASTESGRSGTSYPRCGADTDRQWQCNGAGNRACAKGCHRPGDWPPEAAVDVAHPKSPGCSRRGPFGVHKRRLDSKYVADWVCPKHQGPTA